MMMMRLKMMMDDCVNSDYGGVNVGRDHNILIEYFSTGNDMKIVNFVSIIATIVTVGIVIHKSSSSS